jgi:hypothetical protein
MAKLLIFSWPDILSNMELKLCPEMVVNSYQPVQCDIPEEQRSPCFSPEGKVLIVLSFQYEINAYNIENNTLFLRREHISIMKKCFAFGQIS